MSELVSTVTCPGCGVRLRVKPGVERMKCGRCGTAFKGTSSVNISSKTPEPPIQQRIASSPSPRRSLGNDATDPLGFFSFVWQSYASTHGALPWMFGIVFGFLLMPILSFTKPICSVSTMLWAFVATISLSLILFFLLVVISSCRYLFSKQRTIVGEHRSWMSACICFLAFLAPALGIVSGAEHFGPDEGWFVKFVPQFKKEQLRLLGDVAISATQSSSESSGSEASDVLVNTDSPTETVSESSKKETSENAMAVTTTSGQSNQDMNSTTAPEDSDDEVESPTQKTTQRSKSPNEDENGFDDNSDSKSNQVIAEGVGATADEAIKDAYRNAVRQVVGAVVDAETLITNDEVIDDKVLTYSDGFIKKYVEIAGSNKRKDGLHRIKIKAQVERRSVIAKLKAANVMVKEVDGKGLFAEAVTQLDAENDAAALLKKQFEGFPQSCITVSVIGKPEIVEKTSNKATVKFTVQIEPDMNAFKAFSSKLVSILGELAKEQGEFTAKYKRPHFEEWKGINTGILAATDDNGNEGQRDHEWMPKVFTNGHTWRPGQVSVSIGTNCTQAGDSIDFKYFALDPHLEPVLRAVALRKGNCKLQLLDAAGEIILSDQFEPSYQNDVGHRVSIYGTLTNAYRDERLGGSTFLMPSGQYNSETKLQHLSVAPVFFENASMFRQKAKLAFPRTLTVSLDELKSLQDARVQITFDE